MRKPRSLSAKISSRVLKLLLAVGAAAAPARGLEPPQGVYDLDADAPEPRSKKGQPQRDVEGWNSMTHEATSILGEALYQSRDLSGAREKFHSSLGASTRVRRPNTHLMAMDLFRTAQLEVREGRFASARHHLEILIARYPETSWAEDGRLLLRRLPEAEGPEDDEGPAAAVEIGVQPEAVLKRLQDALKGERYEEALRRSQSFLSKFPERPEADEARLAEAVSRLRTGDHGGAVEVLKRVARSGAGTEERSKARYLLSVAHAMTGDAPALEAALQRGGRDRWSALAQAWGGLLLGGPEATDRLRAATQAAGDSPAKAYALAGLAAEFARQGRPGAAAETMERARVAARRWELESVESYAAISRAHLLAGQRRYRQAAEAYSAFLRRYPSHDLASMAAYHRGMALKRAGMKSDSISAFADLARLYPDSEWASASFLQMGQIYSSQGSVRDAVAAYHRMAEAGGGLDKEAILLIGQVHYNRKDYVKAIPQYLRFLQVAPGDPRSAQVQDLLLTSYWMGARDSPGLEAAVESYPKHPIVAQIRWELVLRHYRRQSWLMAERQFRRLADDFPKNKNVPSALYYNAECRMKLDDQEGAAEVYRTVADNFPGQPFARTSRFKAARAYYEAGRFDKAAALYELLARGGPGAADAAFNRALSLERAGLRAAALRAYESFAKGHPGHAREAWAWFQAGSMHEGAERLGPAAAAYARVRGTRRAQALLRVAGIRERLKQRGGARRAYEELRALRPVKDPHRLQGVLRLALIYEIGSPSKAAPLYREVLALSRDPAALDVARRRLQSLQADRKYLGGR